MDFVNGVIQLFFGPKENGAAEDLEQVIVNFIDQAEFSLEIAVQELDSAPIAAAIERAARRKRPGSNSFLRVRLVTEGDYLVQDKPVEPPDKKVSLDQNRTLLTALLRSAVDAKIDFNPKIFHQKFVIRDENRPRAAVLTGSANFTDTDTHRNLNHLAIFHDQNVVAAYASEFDQLREGMFGARSPKLTAMDPLKLDLEGTELQILFSPDNNPELRLVNEILKAKKTAHLLMFTFAQSTTIDDAFITKLNAGGFKLTGVLDSLQSGQKFSPHPALIAAGAKLRKDKLPKSGKLHHKLLVLDDALTIGGSFNYTGPANRYNDENLFLIRSPLVAQFCRKEVERVYDKLSAKF